MQLGDSELVGEYSEDLAAVYCEWHALRIMEILDRHERRVKEVGNVSRNHGQKERQHLGEAS